MGAAQGRQALLMINTHFLRGFADELVKLAAFPQQHEPPATYDAGVGQVMAQTQGPQAAVGLRPGSPLQPRPAASKRSPTPLTTPNEMVSYTSRGGGAG